MRRLRAALLCALAALALCAPRAGAEQFQRFGAWQVHYIAFNTALLSPRIAERYGIVRGRSKGLVNISAIGPAGRARRVSVRGSFVNLLGQRTALGFREVDDGQAVYYLAAFDYEDAETLRFEIDLDLPGHGAAQLRFQQPLYFGGGR